LACRKFFTANFSSLYKMWVKIRLLRTALHDAGAFLIGAKSRRPLAVAVVGLRFPVFKPPWLLHKKNAAKQGFAAFTD
jgi:hypothetical protein